MKYTCPFCNTLIEVNYPDIIHAGFSDCGFLYCNRYGDLLTWSMYDVGYTTIIKGKPPWSLGEEEKVKIENALIDCPCGGKFKFQCHPRCPSCNNEIPEIAPDRIHWVRLRNLIDGEKQNIWKSQ